MQLQKFITLLSKHELNSGQIENIKKITEISDRFHKEAGISDLDHLHSEINEKTLILESGHQPNFLPHPGTWKKPFLLNFFGNRLNESGKNSMSFFGFADYNISTARILSQNRIPALTKTGSEKIGFKISEKDKWKSFEIIGKPSEQEFEKEIEKIKTRYRNHLQMVKISSPEFESNLREIEEIMWESYKKAKNLADINAFIFSKVCNDLLRLDITFFRYSDLQKEKIFISEWKKIISNLKLYNKIHNWLVKEKNIKGIHLVEENSLPFWYHCTCGGKVPLYVPSNVCTGKCISCNKDYEFSTDDIEKNFPDMCATAISRNLVFSEGLGTALFISGSGGGLRYGQISNEISREINFNLPKTLAWQSRDYYLGISHLAAINELIRILETDTESIADKEQLDLKIKNKKEDLLKKIKESENDKKSLQKYKGQLTNLNTQLGIVKGVFSFTPSFIDQFLSLGNEKILNSWNKALENIEIKKHQDFYIIQKDIIQDNNAQEIYQNLKG